MLIQCSAHGCTEEISVDIKSSVGVRYTCRNHTPPNEDTVRFQQHQFDKDLKRAAHPIGTTHIRRQGEVEDTDTDREIWGTIQGVTKEKDGK